MIDLPPIARYAAAIVIALAAIALRLTLDPVWGLRLPYITLFPAIMVSAWLGGLWPGVVTTAITGVAAVYFWIEPGYSWRIANLSELLGMATFAAVGAVISLLNEAWRRGALALSESEERLAVTLTSIGDAVITTDRRGHVTHLNAVAERLTGWTAAEATGRALGEVFVIINELSRQRVSNPVERVLRERVVAGLANHTLLLSRDGREVPIDDSAAPITTEAGEMTGVVMVFRDITARRQAERAQAAQLEHERLARAQIDRARAEAETAAQQLQTALAAGQMGTWQYTLATGEVRWSPGLEAIHGYAPGTFPGTFDAFREEIHPDDRERVLEAIAGTVGERREHHVEYRIVRRDGSVRWVEGRGQLFLDETQRPDRLTGVCADVTERKQADERFRLAVEAAPAAMLMMDQDGTIVLTNALAERLLGYARDELVGQPIDRLVPSRYRQRHPQFRRAFLADPQQRPMGQGRDLFASRKDGSEVPVEIGLSPIRTHDGTFVLAAVSDVTDRMQMEQQRTEVLLREQAARADLERASRMKDEFLAVLSHELRTPLNAVLGYAHLLSSGVLAGERAAHAIQAIERNARAQERLVAALLDLSRVMAGKLELDRGPLVVSQVIDAAVDAIRPEADAKGLVLDVDLPAADAVVLGDNGRLQQVFGNLLANAVKFTPPAGRISVRARETSSAVQIEIRDTGQGIDPAFLPYVFDRFRQANRGTSGSRAGLGLGLALVRELVEAHGGVVVADSAGEGRGSTFRVSLPLAVTASTPGPADQAEAPIDALPRLDVLIVDDDGDVRELLTLLLEARGASVTAVSSAAEAFDAIARRRPNVLLADLRMPDEDGYSLIQTIRSREREQNAPRLPAIAVTAYAAAGDRDQAMAAGYDAHVPKPIHPDVLLRAVTRVAGVAPV